eukprot:TRINITY_DN38882_c0_g1_i2.p1 TRINITY_DN38882_c0_g1~~TRINITY_DN38882_c0_g1_i2.p1  ORF type:complete len:489 (+),score=68.98 TRINITY_DN38882_c0_g1_i2:53-1519(+)
MVRARVFGTARNHSLAPAVASSVVVDSTTARARSFLRLELQDNSGSYRCENSATESIASEKAHGPIVSLGSGLARSGSVGGITQSSTAASSEAVVAASADTAAVVSPSGFFTLAGSFSAAAACAGTSDDQPQSVRRTVGVAAAGAKADNLSQSAAAATLLRRNVTDLETMVSLMVNDKSVAVDGLEQKLAVLETMIDKAARSSAPGLAPSATASSSAVAWPRRSTPSPQPHRRRFTEVTAEGSAVLAGNHSVATARSQAQLPASVTVPNPSQGLPRSQSPTRMSTAPTFGVNNSGAHPMTPPSSPLPTVATVGAPGQASPLPMSPVPFSPMQMSPQPGSRRPSAPAQHMPCGMLSSTPVSRTSRIVASSPDWRAAAALTTPGALTSAAPHVIRNCSPMRQPPHTFGRSLSPQPRGGNLTPVGTRSVAVPAPSALMATTVVSTPQEIRHGVARTTGVAGSAPAVSPTRGGSSSVSWLGSGSCQHWALTR